MKDIFLGAPDSEGNGKAHRVAGIEVTLKNRPHQEWEAEMMQGFIDDFPPTLEKDDERIAMVEELNKTTKGFTKEAAISLKGEEMIIFVSKVGNMLESEEWIPFGIEVAFMHALIVCHDVQPTDYKLGVTFSGLPLQEETWKLELHFIPEARNITFDG